MPFDINQAIAGLDSGVLLASHFDVQITSAMLGTTNVANELRMVPLLCMGTAMPGIELGSRSIKPYGFGVAQKRPDGAVFEDLELVFIADGKGTAYSLFHKWVRSIYNFDESNSSSSKGLNVGEFEFPSNYESTITLTNYDPTGKAVIKYTINRAYPSGIPGIPVTWEASSEMIRFPVRMSYTNWTSNFIGGTSTTSNKK